MSSQRNAVDPLQPTLARVNANADTRPRPRVSVVIPCYNDAKNLPGLLLRIPADVHEVIVVDGHSLDDTVDVARAACPDALVIKQNRRGKGNALACGLAVATGDVIVTMDADGEADPRDIPRLVDVLVAGADYVTGTRFAPQRMHAGDGRLADRGDRWLSRAEQMLFGAPCTDLAYPYNAWWAHVLPALNLSPWAGSGSRCWGDGPEVDIVIPCRMAKAGVRITEVPVTPYRVRRAASGASWRESARVLWALLVERCNRREGVPGAVEGEGVWSG